ncbi:hypothetical protein PC118_g8208 [Phytophthora cactorum]|uniref:Uncharacterized protein n=1 Tax=Phytophthora cactorum TaxID=29920 RepID=A0A8T1G435_9STRA|nr:hypothetical protein PC118_g8208 [Phytophthora cactorum]
MARTLGAKDISPKTCVAVIVYLTTQSKEGRLRYGTIERAKKLFQLSRAAIEVIWGLRDDPAALVQPRRPYLPQKTSCQDDPGRYLHGSPRTSLHPSASILI